MLLLFCSWDKASSSKPANKEETQLLNTLPNLFLMAVHYTRQHMSYLRVLLLESVRDQLYTASFKNLGRRTPDPSSTWQEMHRRNPRTCQKSRSYSLPCLLHKCSHTQYCIITSFYLFFVRRLFIIKSTDCIGLDHVFENDDLYPIKTAWNIHETD